MLPDQGQGVGSSLYNKNYARRYDHFKVTFKQSTNGYGSGALGPDLWKISKIQFNEFSR